MKAPPLVFLILSIIIIVLPLKCSNWGEKNILTLTRPFSYLYSATPSASKTTVNPTDRGQTAQKTQTFKPKDKIQELEEKIAELNNEILLLKNENADLAGKLKKVSDFRESFGSATNIRNNYNVIVADVIFKLDVSIWRESILINRGSNDGIKPGMTVVLGKSLVGRISSSDLGPSTSRVQLITDPAFRAQVMIAPPIGQPVEATVKPSTSPAGPPPAGTHKTIGLPKKAAAETADSLRLPVRGPQGHPVGGTQTGPAVRTATSLLPAGLPASGGAKGDQGFGVLAGVSFDHSLIRWVFREVQVSKGWDVFSAPDPYAVIPRGLIVGKVNDVSIDGFFYTLTVSPAVDFYNLAYVLVIAPALSR